MINYDVTRRPGRPSEWKALVEAICASEEPVESFWLECKTVNWSSAGSIANIARAVLGMANRDPDRAAPFLGGSGLVLIGLNDKTRAIEPLEVIDSTDVENKLTPYVGGGDGPRWRPEWMTLAGQPLLLIEVEPHGPGTPGYLLRQGSGDFKTGQLFVREGSKTVPASQGDLIRLAKRLTVVPTKETLDVVVGYSLAEPLPKVGIDEANVEAFLSRERATLLAYLDNPRKPPNDGTTFEAVARQRGIVAAATAFGGILNNDHWEEEDRKPDQYRSEVEAYLLQARDALGESLGTILDRVVPITAFWISNLSDRNFRDVEVTIRVEGDAEAHTRDHGDELSLRKMMPRRPRRFGGYMVRAGSSLLSPFERMGGFIPAPAPYFPSINPGRHDIRNGGSFEIDFDTLQLRPREQEVPLGDDPVILIPTRRTDPVVVHWHVTASNVNAVAEDVFELPFDAVAVDPLKLGLADEDR